MTEISFRTPKGAMVTLEADDAGLTIIASVNGKAHTSFGVTYAHNSVIGHHVTLAGKGKAQIADADVAAVEVFFADAAKTAENWKKNYVLSASDRSGSLTKRMGHAYSDL